jgi:hypothetical protein
MVARLFDEHGPVSDAGYVWAVYASSDDPQDEPLGVFDDPQNASAFATTVDGLVGRLDNKLAVRVPPLA